MAVHCTWVQNGGGTALCAHLFIFLAAIQEKVKISIVSYLNTLPFRWAIRNSALTGEISLSEDIPRVCAEKLLSGEADLALVPVAVIPQMQRHYIVSDYCIGADGIVDSVKLYHDLPVDQIKNVLLDYQSRTSVNLTRVLFRFWWKTEPEFTDALSGFEEQVRDGTAAVVIGDRTFALNGRYRFETDLAQAWKDFTGLPFVFAAWVSSKPLAPDFIGRFNAVLRNGIENIEQAVKDAPDYGSLPKKMLAEYLNNKINYVLDEKKLQAMRMFHDYLTRL